MEMDKELIALALLGTGSHVSGEESFMSPRLGTHSIH
jgi:hypothetical protein